jgi:uncharacterized membrane protein
MKIKTYNYWRITVLAVAAIVIAVSAAFGNVCGVLLAVAIGMLVLFLLRRMVKDVVRDERTETIGHKAAQLTLFVIGIGMPVIGAVLVAIGWDDPASSLRPIGDGLLYATCGLLVINALAHTYFGIKFGGKNE